MTDGSTRWSLQPVRRLFAASVTAVVFVSASTLGSALLSLLEGGQASWLSNEAMTRATVSSFLGGLLFFPVQARSLQSRARFTAKALFTGAILAFTHRVLYAGFDGYCTGLDSICGFSESLLISRHILVQFLAHPDLARLLPSAVVGNPGLMEVLSIGFSGALAYVVHPALVAAIRRRGQGSHGTSILMPSVGVVEATVSTSEASERRWRR